MKNNHPNTNASLLHLSALTGFLFPLGSIITPLIMWLTLKNKSPYLDKQGKEVINFNSSFCLYTILASIFFSMFFFKEVLHLFNQINLSNANLNLEVTFLGLFSIGIFICFINLTKIALIIIASLKTNKITTILLQ